MWVFNLLSLLAVIFVATARSPQHVGKKLPERSVRSPPKKPVTTKLKVETRQSSRFMTVQTSRFSVNGSGLPDVDFDIGESYAGLLPISNTTNSPELYFWFFPSQNPAAENDITIWLNGGPGCSSLEGFFQENGPVIWQYGTFKPVPNPYSWVNLTNMIWVEQPVGTGFSQGTPTATSEADVAAQFLGFWRNMVDTFALQGFTVYITGESYAGYYVPYIADSMFNANDKEYYNVSSIMIYNPSLSSDAVQEQIPAVPFADYWGPLLALNETFNDDIHKRADACNYTSFLRDHLVFPPRGPLPTPPNIDGDKEGCDLWSDIYYAASAVNPCFDIYQVATTCPLLWDVLGFPGSFNYVPEGAEVYFNRSDVQAAINAPIQEWAECTNIDVFVNGTDNSPPSGLGVLPTVIDKAERTIIGHGLLDYILIYNGTLLAIQNMTFGGSQGFSSLPEDDFIVPNLYPELSLSSLAGSGVLGKYRTEKKLTLVSVTVAGHMVPQYAPSAAYRQMEFLLGRIPSLGTAGSFTTQMETGGAYGPFKASVAQTTCDNSIVC